MMRNTIFHKKKKTEKNIEMNGKVTGSCLQLEEWYISKTAEITSI